jgi:hypothetical protein
MVRTDLRLTLALSDFQPVPLILPDPINERHQFIRQMGKRLLKDIAKIKWIESRDNQLIYYRTS